MPDATRTSKLDVDALARRVRGAVLTPGSEQYDQGCTGFQLGQPHRPAVVVEATGAQDVRAALEFAADAGARVAVQATGHGRTTALEGGVLINTRRMSGVHVDARTRTARVEAGASWQQVIEAAAPHGLAPLSGSFPGVGAVGYTLGGGVGLLARRHGFAADHVRRFELATVDGSLREVTPDGEPELFWGLRGGGGNFGVVTGMEIELVPVTGLYGGSLFFDVAEVPHVLEAWREWTSTAPEEMTSAVAVLPYPDVEGVPAPLRGRYVAQIQLAHLGSAAEGERVLQPLRELGPHLQDTLRELPYAESGSVFAEPDQPHAYRSDHWLLADLDPRALATLPGTTGPEAPVMCVVSMRHLGGALARPPRIPNAVGHRRAAYSLGVLSPVRSGEEDLVRAVHAEAFEPFTEHALGRSLNYSYGPRDAEQTRAGFEPDTYRRLARLKAQHDPQQRLHTAHPIQPATDRPPRNSA